MEEFIIALKGFDIFSGANRLKDAKQIKIINQLWAKYDTDLSGELDYRETKRYVKDTIGGIPDEMFLHVFNTFDKDNSGSIGKSEMIDFINMLHEEAGA